MPLRVIFRRLLCESIVVFSLLSCKDERICVVKPHSPVDTDPVKTTCYADLGAIISLTKVNDGFVASFHRDTLLFGWLDKEMRLRQRFCRRGNGPGEMVAPVYCGQYSVCDGNAVISVLDRPKSTLYSYQITEEEVKMCPESVTFSRDQEGLRKVFHVNGGWLILSDDTTQGVYISSEDGQEIKPVEIPDRKPSYLIPGVYQTSSTIRPDSSIVALAYYLLPRIDLIGADGTCRKSLIATTSFPVALPCRVCRYPPQQPPSLPPPALVSAPLRNPACWWFPKVSPSPKTLTPTRLPSLGAVAISPSESPPEWVMSMSTARSMSLTSCSPSTTSSAMRATPSSIKNTPT